MIKILDYGVGNVRAFLSLFHRLDLPAEAAATAAALDGASHLILPGVGAFDQAMAMFDASGMRSQVEDLVLGERIPLLGVCVGMQMLARRSSEGVRAGLGWIEGDVQLLGNGEAGERLPHMGWNDIRPVGDHVLARGLEDGRAYFLHSYVFELADRADEIAVTDYVRDFSCMIGHQNIVGVQFHPEKSHRWGAQILRNFARMHPC